MSSSTTTTTVGWYRRSRRAAGRVARRVPALRRLPRLQGGRPGSATGRPSPGHADDTRGRWIRTGGPDVAPEATAPLAPADPTEASAVRAGWSLVAAYERLTTRGAQLVFAPELDAWERYAQDTVATLQNRAGRPEFLIGHTRLRFRRTMDFARPGDRVFDVGVGRGHLACLLLRDREIAHYAGVDLLVQNVTATRQLAEVNGLTAVPPLVEQGDLFALTREQVSATDPTLMICCEVLEHVDDPEHALATLAAALPDGADLLFSVPLHGRLEAVWGHCSVFDVDRLQRMATAAGLWVHHVEPLANTWTLVVASRDPGASQRVREALHRPEVPVQPPLSRDHAFVNVPAADIRAIDARGRLRAQPLGKGRATGVLADATGGVLSFPVRGLEALRFRVVPQEGALRDLQVSVKAGTTRVAGWHVTIPPGVDRHRVALRPGESYAIGYTAFDRLADVDRVEVVVRVDRGAPTRFELEAAYLP